ncbi:hypothetical protein KFU94_01240 [Chloroflexi bacterium TSY]|nr:hypothetical protein [Chloroflexi bacterium TSY]
MGLGNNLTTDYAYTPNNFRLQSITSGAIQNLSYTYDAVGNVRTIQDGSNENQVQQFECDHLNRLTHAFTVGAGPGQYDRRYEYDVLGNIARRFENTIQYEYSYNGDRPHAVTAIQIPGMGGASWTYGYDNNGNMDIRNENAQLHNQTFDVLNRLVAVTVNGETTEFGYGESEQRVKTLKPDGTQVSVDPNFRFRERIWAN